MFNRLPRRINMRRFTPTHIIVTLLKGKNLKSSKKKITHIRNTK